MSMFISTNTVKLMVHSLGWCQKYISEDIIIIVAAYYNLPIKHIEFVFDYIDTETYQIHVLFHRDTHHSSKHTLTFAKTRIANMDMNAEIELDNYLHFVWDLAKNGCNVMDIWPLNGIIKKKQFIKNTLKGELKYLEELSKLLKFKKDKKHLKNNSLKLMVLDLKDKDTNYENKETILKHEIEIGTFFHKNNKLKINKRAKKQLSIYNLFCEEFNVEYILKEGSLKHDLLYDSNIFNLQEIAYFNSAEGGKDLCQLCELIMNGFKTLFQIETQQTNNKESYVFHPRNYLIHIPSLLNKKTERIKADETQNIPYLMDDIGLITFYPPCYLNVYSKDKPYYQCISKFDKFEVQHDVFDDFSNITCIQIDNKSTLLNINTMVAPFRNM